MRSDVTCAPTCWCWLAIVCSGTDLHNHLNSWDNFSTMQIWPHQFKKLLPRLNGLRAVARYSAKPLLEKAARDENDESSSQPTQFDSAIHHITNLCIWISFDCDFWSEACGHCPHVGDHTKEVVHVPPPGVFCEHGTAGEIAWTARGTLNKVDFCKVGHGKSTCLASWTTVLTKIASRAEVANPRGCCRCSNWEQVSLQCPRNSMHSGLHFLSSAYTKTFSLYSPTHRQWRHRCYQHRSFSWKNRFRWTVAQLVDIKPVQRKYFRPERWQHGEREVLNWWRIVECGGHVRDIQVHFNFDWLQRWSGK